MTIRVLDEITPLAGDALQDRARLREGDRDQGRVGAAQPFRGDQQGPGRHAVRPRLLRRGDAARLPARPDDLGRRHPPARRHGRQSEAGQSEPQYFGLHPAAVQDRGLRQWQAVFLHQLELQPGLLGARRPVERSRRAGRLQGEVRLRPRPGQDHRADARHRRVLHPQEGRDAGRQAAGERLLRHRAGRHQRRLHLPDAVGQSDQELWRRPDRRAAASRASTRRRPWRR